MAKTTMRMHLQNISARREANGKDLVALFGDAIFNDQPPGLLAHHRKRRSIVLADWQVHKNSVLKTPRASIEHVFGKDQRENDLFTRFHEEDERGSDVPSQSHHFCSCLGKYSHHHCRWTDTSHVRRWKGTFIRTVLMGGISWLTVGA